MTGPATNPTSPDRLRTLIARYDRPGPRYTSYPTAPVWSDEFGEEAFREALRRSTGQQRSVYVHIPFCERLCSFCACNRRISQDHSVAAPYLDAIEREAEMIASELATGPQTVQFAVGGGSPNFLSEAELARMSEIVDRCFPPAADAERSIELDPRNTTRGQLEALGQHGFNRMSLGVQDTSPRVQRAINRIQSRAQIEALVQGARDLGMSGVNFDLIYGLPYQTVESFDDTLNQVIEMRPDRIALYSYAHVTWISKAQRGFEKKDLPLPDQKVAIFLHAVERLESAGYLYLGLDHFALPDDELARAAAAGALRRNFMGYTVRPGVDLIALGASGISELADSYAQSTRDPDEYEEAANSGHLPTLRGCRLTEDDVRRRWLIHGVMCQSEINGTAYQQRFDESLETRVPDLHERLAEFVEDGLLEQNNGTYRVTRLGRLFLRVIAMTFDAHLEPPDPEKPQFSKTV
jgi:oxygen-independent coproporphyrinogen-3 oxidase